MSPTVHMAGYTLTERIQETRATTVFRGVRESDGESILVRLLRDEYPTPIDLARLRHEYALFRSIAAPGVARALDLISSANRLGIVLEDAGPRSLRDVIDAGRPEPSRFLELAIGLAEVVGSIHRLGILHKDIKPEHFLVDARTGALKLIDFGASTRLSR